MRSQVIEIQIDEPFQEQASSETLHRAALTTLAHQRVEGACELTVVVTDDEALHELSSRS